MFKYAITMASFREIESLEQTLTRISGLGYDSVEMYGEPDVIDVKELNELFNSYRMPVSGITGMWGTVSGEGWKRKLLSLDAGMQKHAKDYVKKCIRMCRSLGGKHLNICLFANSVDDDLSFFERTHRIVSVERKNNMQNLAIPILSELAEFATEYDVSLLIEPLNRYSTPYCSTADDALAIAERIDNDYIGIMLDTFHMNIEEDSFEHTIARSAHALRHMHFADNNRKMCGYGHIDFGKIVKSLLRTGYDDHVTFEPTIYCGSEYETPLQNGLQFIKRLEADSRGQV